MKTETVLAKGGVLLLARVVQTGLGVVTFLLIARTLGPSGYGEWATAASIGGSVAALLDAALVDTAVVADEDEVAALSARAAVGIAGAATLAAMAALLSGRSHNVVLAILGVGLFVAATAGTSDRLAHARSTGDSRRLAFIRVAGAAATLVLVGVLLGLHLGWGPLTVSLVAPAALLFMLPAPPRREHVRPPVDLPRAWRRSAPFLLSQSAWMVLTQAPILLTRAIAGARAAGEYGGLTRLLDLLGLIGPIMANFALPAFVAHFNAGRAGRVEAGRLNGLIALAGVLAVTVGAQGGWWFWHLTYPHVPFPAVAFALLACAAGVSQACGLPDRVLQAAGRARLVSLIGLSAALVMIGAGIPAIAAFGLTGAGGARLAAVSVANLWLLLASGLPGAGKAMNLSLIAPVIATALVLSSRIAEGSYLLSVAIGTGAVFLSLGAAAPGYLALRREKRNASG